MLQTEI
jgi:hypothetical protein